MITVEIPYETWRSENPAICRWLDQPWLGWWDYDVETLWRSNSTTELIKRVDPVGGRKLKCTPVEFVFEDAQDALLFKLAWGGIA